MAFGGLDELQLHVAIALASFIDLGSQIIDFARFGRESHGRTDALGRFLEGAGLPVRANLMIAGIDGKVKIGLAFVGADPRAIELDPHGRAILYVLEEIHNCFARIRRCDRVLLLVGFYVEMRLARAAATAGRNHWGRLLGENGRREETKQKDYPNVLHHKN